MKYEITPVQNVNGLWFKREDLFCPFGIHSVNGGKLRQCFALIEAIKNDYDEIVSFCSIHSPQAPITSAVSKYFGKKCVIMYGGTTKETLNHNEMATIVKEYGATIEISAKTGRHNVLLKKATEYAEQHKAFIVEYGFNIVDYPDILLNAVATQVQNIPDELENLIITCGSGITTTGVLIGLNKYKKKVKTIHLVNTAPNREKKIRSNLKKYGVNYDDFNIQIHDLFNSRGFQYEKETRVVYKGIELHPQYEAKSFSWLYHHSNINIHDNKSLFWIVGSKPRPKKIIKRK